MDSPGFSGAPVEKTAFLRGIRDLSGREILQRLMLADDPKGLVTALPEEDFYWVVKKLGEQEMIFLLELASEDQWQYVLDLELWHKDRLNPVSANNWLSLIAQADPRRLSRWLFSEGELFAFYHFFRTLDVIGVETDEETWNIPDGYFTVDGVFYVHIEDSEHRPVLEKLLRVMADEDYERFQSLLTGLSGVLPAELEEEVYRWRNVRLAEHGFLPQEEALEVYSPLDLQVVKGGAVKTLPGSFKKGVGEDLIPLAPLEHIPKGNLLTEAVLSNQDPGMRDRLRVEFAGLCNQVLSADGGFTPEYETLIRTCRKAASYVNLGLEGLCGKDVDAVGRILEDQSLTTLFRVGYGLALKIKWEAERWVQTSWFAGKKLDPEFWGEYWGGALLGVLQPRPTFYVGEKEGEEFRDFEWLSDLAECLKVIRRLMVLDGLLERLTGIYPMDPEILETPDLSFRPLFFNLWSRGLIKAHPSFRPLSQAQAEKVFRTLRGPGSETGPPPYPMTGYEEKFLRHFMAFASHSDREAASVLEETLMLIWQEFQEEYQWVSLDDLDSRYSKFIGITP